MEPPDPNDHLLERIVERSNMQSAWKRVKANKGAGGVDNMAIDQFASAARNMWPQIRQSLLAGTYQPKPVKRVSIPKATGGLRPLGIPTVLDRLIQQAIAQVLMPIFDPDFSDHSYGFRPGRSAHGAVRKVQAYIKEGYRHAVDMDLEKFFDTVNHDVLMHRVAKTDRTNFLGFTFRGTKIRWSDAAFREFKRRIRKLTGRSWFVSMEYRLKKLAQYLRGWINYFGISEYYRPIPEIDHWLRRRVRMCYWKQWRFVRTKVRNLLKLGTHPGVAIPMSLSRKGPWKCARTMATQTGMTNKWLKDLGLLSVKELWVNIHYPATAR
jgi:retron-type reverse transcriptase